MTPPAKSRPGRAAELLRLAAAAVALPACAVVASAVPVDLRPPSPPSMQFPIAAAAPPQARDAADVGPQVMASRAVLNDLLSIGEALSLEAGGLDRDATDLWTQWRTFVPVQPWDASFTQPATTGWLEQLRQSEVFALHTQTRLLASRVEEHVANLRSVESLWWRKWKALDESERGVGSAKAVNLPALRARLEALAAESNALDGGLRQAQGQYDVVRPLSLDHLGSVRGASVHLPQARHWGYAASGRVRPDHRYDFSSRYERHHADAILWLKKRTRTR